MLKGIIARLVAFTEIHARERGEFKQPPQILAAVAHHPEEVNHLPVEVVIHLGVAARFTEKHRSATTEGLNVAPVGWEMANDPRSQLPLAAVIADQWAFGGNC